MNINIAVIGAGPAGMSAALWLKILGFTPYLIERGEIAGGMQRLNFLQNDWVLGQAGKTGVEIAETFQQHIEENQIKIHYRAALVSIARRNTEFLLSFSNLPDVSCHAIIIATGTRYLGREIISHVAGFNTIDEKCFVEGPYTFLDLDKLPPQTIAVIGGGDNAIENATMLLERGFKVFVFARSKIKAQAKLKDKLAIFESCEIYENALIENFSAYDQRVKVKLNDSSTPEITVDRFHILAGYKPNTKEIVNAVSRGLNEELMCNSKGYLSIDKTGKTSVDRIYAAGDVADTQYPCVVNAINQGAIAAKTISRDIL